MTDAGSESRLGKGMVEFASTPVVRDNVGIQCRNILGLMASIVWEALPDDAVQCVFIGTNAAGKLRWETHFYYRDEEKYSCTELDEQKVANRVLRLVAELQNLRPIPGTRFEKHHFVASIAEEDVVQAEFLCVPDMVDEHTEVFMCRVQRDLDPARGCNIGQDAPRPHTV